MGSPACQDRRTPPSGLNEGARREGCFANVKQPVYVSLQLRVPDTSVDRGAGDHIRMGCKALSLPGSSEPSSRGRTLGTMLPLARFGHKRARLSLRPIGRLPAFGSTILSQRAGSHGGRRSHQAERVRVSRGAWPHLDRKDAALHQPAHGTAQPGQPAHIRRLPGRDDEASRC